MSFIHRLQKEVSFMRRQTFIGILTVVLTIVLLSLTLASSA